MKIIKNVNRCYKIVLEDNILDTYVSEKIKFKDKEVYDIKAKDGEPFRILLNDDNKSCFHNIMRISYTDIQGNDNLSLWSNEGLVYSMHINEFKVRLFNNLGVLTMEFIKNKKRK